VRSDQVVESTPEPGGAISQLVGECTLASSQSGGRLTEGAVEPPPPLRLDACAERGLATGDRAAQSSRPVVGDDGTAISLDGIRPAR
jgi:hypothetical protein